MNRILEFIIGVVLIGTALAFGGVQTLAYSLAEIALFLAVLFLLFKQARQGRIDLPLPVWPVLFALVVALQAVPLPSWLVVRLSPARQLDADLANLSTGKWIWTTLSIYPHATVVTLFKFLAYLGAFVLAGYFFDSRKGRSVLLQCLMILGLFEATYGTYQYLTGSPKIFAYTKEYDIGQATGTYINRNHFAGLLELALCAFIASIYYSFQIWSESRSSGGGQKGHRSGSSLGFRTVFYVFLLVIVVVGVGLSRSRTGILAALFSLVFVALLAQFRARQKGWMLGVFFFVVCLVGYALWIGLDPVLARFEQLREPGYRRLEARLSFAKDEARIVRDYPLVGTGLGTFGIAFRHYQTTFVDSYADHAHNDYLEFASETGLLGAALLLLPIFYLFGRMIFSFISDPRRYRSAATLGCIAGTLSLFLHSFTDFNLQIPANALIFAVISGIGYKATCVERRGEALASVTSGQAVPAAVRHAADA